MRIHQTLLQQQKEAGPVGHKAAPLPSTQSLVSVSLSVSSICPLPLPFPPHPNALRLIAH